MKRFLFYVYSAISTGSLIFAMYAIDHSQKRVEAVQERLCYLQEIIALYDPECHGGQPKPEVQVSL